MGVSKLPSEKESGVKFKMAITRVLRSGSSARRGSVVGDNGVRVEMGDDGDGSALR